MSRAQQKHNTRYMILGLQEVVMLHFVGALGFLRDSTFRQARSIIRMNTGMNGKYKGMPEV